MKRKPMPENQSFCMAAWTHTHLSPMGERRLCCLSQDESPFVQHFLAPDGKITSQNHKLADLKEYWNSETMRSVRKRMLQGETLPECAGCDRRLVTLHSYRDHFNKSLFPHLVKTAFESTLDDGTTTMNPISFDYRLSNACNFKCRMCGAGFSSSWEIERIENDDLDIVKHPWMEKKARSAIREFQSQVAEREFSQAVEKGLVEDIYWAGGEPLLMPVHWRIMERLIELGNAPKVSVRYNTNLSHIDWRGKNLFKDILPHFKNYNVCASIDGAGKVGEFLRTGLDWQKWLENFKLGAEASRSRPHGLVMDVTLTLPGLFGLKDLFDLAREMEVGIIAKIVQINPKNILLSPHSLPRPMLESLIDPLVSHMDKNLTAKTEPLLSALLEVRQRPTFEEKFGSQWTAGSLLRGHAFMRELARRRGDGQQGRPSIEDIYKAHAGVYQWWTSVS